MAAQEFTVLYTHQKTKKAKVWQDGILKVLSGGNQASLFSDKGQRLDNVFIKTGKVNIGDDLESDRYLITVEAEGTSSNPSVINTLHNDSTTFTRSSVKTAGLRPPAGLKRKFTGFQCPREITKKPCPEVEESERTSLLEQRCTSLSSPLFTTSPLFAASVTKKADSGIAAQWQSSNQPEDCSYIFEKQSSVICRNIQVNGNTSFSFVSSIKSQADERETIGDINVPGDGKRPKQSIRSTAQILALLKSQPSKEETSTNLADADINRTPVKPSNDLGSTFSHSTSSHLLKCDNICQESSPEKIHPVKSRWDIYLDQPPVLNTDYSDDNNTFVLSGSPDDGPINSFLNHKMKEEAIKEINLWTSGAEKPQKMTNHKLNDLEHVGRLSDIPLQNVNVYCENNPCESSLSHMESPAPVLRSTSSSQSQTKLELDVALEKKIVEVSFNLMDSFDFSELDDEDSNMALSKSQNEFLSANENMDECQENVVEKCSESNVLFKPVIIKSLLDENGKKCMNDTTCIVPVPAGISSNISESKPDEFAIYYKQADSDVCGPHKEEISRGEKLLTFCDSKSKFFSLHNKGDIPCCRSALKSVDFLEQEGSSFSDDTICKVSSCSSLAQNPHKDVQFEEDSPGFPQAGSSISVLKSLTKPCSALESLNSLKLKSFSTLEKEDCESGTCMKSGALEDLPRTNHLAIKLPSCDDDEPAVPSFTAPVQASYSPLCDEDDAQTLCFHQSLSPPLNSPFSLNETSFDYSGLSQTDLMHTMTSYESSSSSSMQCPLPQWTVETQGSDCDWEFSQWAHSKVNTPTQEMSDNLNHQFFLRPRQCMPVESLGGFFQQHSVMDSGNLSKVQSRLQMQEPVITQPETVVSLHLTSTDGGSDFPEIQTQNRFLLNTNSCISKEISFNTVADKSQGEDYLFKCLGTGPTLPNNVPESSNKQPSKWLKYQDVSENPQNLSNEQNTEFCAQSVFKHPEGTEVIQDNEAELTQKVQFGHQSSVVSRVELITKGLIPTNDSVLRMTRNKIHFHDKEDKQILLPCDLSFPPKHIVLSASVPKRKVNIPAVFQSSAHYKQVFSASLAEHLNIIMFELSQRLHKALSKVDISFYTSEVDETNRKDKASPLCLHQQPTKLVMVRKEGPNKGRFFYTCDAPKADQCKYFKWLDEVKGTKSEKGKVESRLVIGDMKSLSKYIRCQNINLYEESQLMIRKTYRYPKRQFGKFAKVVNTDAEFGGESKTKLYLKLNRKDNSSTYSKDDVWVVSKTLNFDPMDTFIACSAFYGPSANNDIEISPLKGYCPSNWRTNSG